MNHRLQLAFPWCALGAMLSISCTVPEMTAVVENGSPAPQRVEMRTRQHRTRSTLKVDLPPEGAVRHELIGTHLEASARRPGGDWAWLGFYSNRARIQPDGTIELSPAPQQVSREEQP
jgi:hypothetical protein